MSGYCNRRLTAGLDGQAPAAATCYAVGCGRARTRWDRRVRLRVDSEMLAG
jgi:hypothetical protein